MPGYDPRRSRPTPKVAPDEESAPIDALLGPDPTPTAVPPPTAEPEATREPAPQPEAPAEPVPEATTPAATSRPTSPEPTAVPVRAVERAPSALLQLSPLLLAGAVAVMLAWLLRRRRR